MCIVLTTLWDDLLDGRSVLVYSQILDNIASRRYKLFGELAFNPQSPLRTVNESSRVDRIRLGKFMFHVFGFIQTPATWEVKRETMSFRLLRMHSAPKKDNQTAAHASPAK